MTLSLEEWRKLSEEQKGIRYKELSDHDKFIVRTSTPPAFEVTGRKELSEEEKKRAKKEFKTRKKRRILSWRFQEKQGFSG